MTRTKRNRTNVFFTFISVLAGIVFASTGSIAEDVPPAAIETARTYLQDALGDDTRLPIVLVGLRSTRDRELLPLFSALMRSTDRQTRLMATAMISQVGGEKINATLRARLANDPAMAVRAEALVQLLHRQAMTTQQLRDALKLEDDGVRMIAARALVQRGKGPLAVDTLKSFLRHRDPETVAAARMSLFGLGIDAKTHKAELRKVLIDPKTPEDLFLRLLKQIREEKIKSAAEVARFLASPKHSRAVRVQAYMALADVQPDASKMLAEAIAGKDESDLFRINLIRILSEQPDAKYWLDDLARRDDLAGAVARFELARSLGGKKASRALQDLVIELGHPVLLEYALNRMRNDVERNKKRAAFYVGPMVQVLRQTEIQKNRMTAQHDRLAMIVEQLANLGTPEALAGLKTIFDGPDTPTRKLTAGALYRSTNPAVCDLVRPGINSAFSDQRIYVALTLARHGHREAIPALLDVQAHAATHRPDVLTLANWYLLKLAGHSPEAVETLSGKVR